MLTPVPHPTVQRSLTPHRGNPGLRTQQLECDPTPLSKKKCLIKKKRTSGPCRVWPRVLTLVHTHDCNRTAALEISLLFFLFFFFSSIFTWTLFYLVGIDSLWVFVSSVSHSASCTSLLCNKEEKKKRSSFIAKRIRNDVGKRRTFVFFYPFISTCIGWRARLAVTLAHFFASSSAPAVLKRFLFDKLLPGKAVEPEIPVSLRSLGAGKRLPEFSGAV